MRGSAMVECRPDVPAAAERAASGLARREQHVLGARYPDVDDCAGRCGIRVGTRGSTLGALGTDRSSELGRGRCCAGPCRRGREIMVYRLDCPSLRAACWAVVAFWPASGVPLVAVALAGRCHGGGRDVNGAHYLSAARSGCWSRTFPSCLRRSRAARHVGLLGRGPVGAGICGAADRGSGWSPQQWLLFPA